MAYRIEGLDPAEFAPLFGLGEEELEARGIVRMTVTDKPSFPCRITLEDREIGETVLLLNHVSQGADTPSATEGRWWGLCGGSAPTPVTNERPK